MKKLLASFMLVAASTVCAVHAQSIDAKLELLGTPKTLRVTELSSRVTNDILILNLDVRNQDDRDAEAFYRVRWLDQSGDMVAEEEAWKPLLFHGDQNIHLRMSAPNSKARDFRIQFSATDNTHN